MYQYLLSGAVLLFCSAVDIKHHRVHKGIAMAYSVLALLGHLAGGAQSPAALAAGLLPGACCFLISLVSREGLGFGDSALITGCGVSLGLWPCLGILFTALLLSGLWAAVLLVFRRVRRGQEIPFVPFLLLGLLIQWMGETG